MKRTTAAPLSFRPITREIRSLVGRRRSLLTMLGSTFAGMGLLLENALKGSLPSTLKTFQGHVFLSYALLLLLPSLILALRLARLNAGMVLNGVLFARLLEARNPARKGAVERASRMNIAGVSFQMFLLTDIIAAFSTSLLCLVLSDSEPLAAVSGAAALLAGLGFYIRFHREAVARGLRSISDASCGGFSAADWQEHISGSLEDVHFDMTAVVSLVGLIMFSAIQSLSILGSAAGPTDIPPDVLRLDAPAAYGSLMAATCLMGMATYIRLRIAAGSFSIELDPADEPFRPLHMTDSLLGFTLLAFMFAVSAHFLLSPLLAPRSLAAAVAAAFILALAWEQTAVAVAKRKRLGYFRAF